MASTSSTTSVSKKQRRWVVIGVCLTKVLTPALRNVLATELGNWHPVLCQPPTEIDKQVFGGQQKTLHPSTLKLNYKNINNNDAIKSPRAFDYQVKDAVSLAKLFVQPFMSKFTGFDETMDLSAVLSVICEAAPFVGAAADAKTVRSDIRNDWAHCNFAEWTKAKFKDAFRSMETLLKNVNLPPNDAQELCDELNNWKTKGFQLCFGQPVDNQILNLLRSEVDELREAVKTWSLNDEKMSKLVVKLDEMHRNLGNEIDNLRTRMEKAEIQVTTNSLTLKRHATQIDDIAKKGKRTDELSRYHVKEEEKIPYVFTAPPRNGYFAGRTEEIQKLKRILEVEETLSEKKVRVTAVCGLGGIGKTSLVSEYAHQMKEFYKGGVFWFSAEDDAHLSKTVNAVAVKIGALLNTFELTFSNILRKISTVHDPCLIVLDCLDQLDLTSNMLEFLSFPSKENFFGHFIVLTRRNPKRLVNDISVFEEKFCLQLECLQSEDAKQFLFSRTKVTRDENENAESIAECLCEKLGRLPLALEQAGAYMQMLGCSLSSYLEQYEAQRLQLLRLQAARPVSPGNESSHRLAVHTTWRINIEYIEKSTNGQAAVRFINACSFFDENEIQKELVNVGTPEVEDVAYRTCVSSPLGSCQVLKLLTDFSLFTYFEAGCVTTHRLVQELVWENLDSKSKGESFIDAVRMLSFAFSKCPSPSNHVSLDERNGEEQDISFSGLPNGPSHFYMWSKFCMHGHRLRRNVEDLLVSLDSVCLDSVWFPETAKILYECAVHLSANHQQEEAKRTLNFAYRILDWLPLAGYEMVEKNVSDNVFFPLPIPLPELFQMMIQRPTFILLESLTEKRAPDGSDLAPDASDLVSDASDLALDASDLAPDASDLVSDASELAPDASDLAREASNPDPDKKIGKFELDGNKAFKEGCFQEALDAYSSAINLAQDCNKPFDPLLLTERSMVYIKLEEWENALKDANDYITRRPYCWRGYALKALAHGGLNKEVSTNRSDFASAEIAAALAFYRNRDIFTDFPIFVEYFPDLQSRIFICDSVDELLYAMFSQEVETGLLKILVLGSEEYILDYSETASTPWNNCILVGTRKNCSISLKSNCDISLLKCMLTNLSFSSKSRLYCLPDSFVKILNCNFSYVYGSIKTKGVFNAEHCSFARSPLVCSKESRATVQDCSFCNNAGFGLRVEKGGSLKIQNSRIHNNACEGLVVAQSECVAVNFCDIHDNGRDGINAFKSANLTLERNNVCNNNGDGIRMEESYVDVIENKLSDNGTRGILGVDNPWWYILKNEIFRNKSGGVSLLCDPEEEGVVNQNKIYLNGGPGLLVNDKTVGESWYSKNPNSFQPVEFENNEMHHNKEKENDSNLNLSVPFCSHCRVKCKPTMCEKCFTTAYCSESCQKQHYSKHKEICKVLREKSSYLITSTQEAGKNDMDVDDPEKYLGPEENDSPEADDSSEEYFIFEANDCSEEDYSPEADDSSEEDDDPEKYLGPEEDNCSEAFLCLEKDNDLEEHLGPEEDDCSEEDVCSEEGGSSEEDVDPEEYLGPEEDDCSEEDDSPEADGSSEEDDDPEEYLGPEEVGPKLASPPGEDLRFVVKVHNAGVRSTRNSCPIVLYDRNREHRVQCYSKLIPQLLKEFGMLCRSRDYQKKLFFHCLCEDNGQLRLFTNEFAEFQNW